MMRKDVWRLPVARNESYSSILAKEGSDMPLMQLPTGKLHI